MASSDFDDIFGDLKEDQQFSASLASGADLDDASIFGDAPSAVLNTKPTADKPSSAAATSGGAESQDEFLSWLDDAPPTVTTTSSPSPVTSETVTKTSSAASLPVPPAPRPPAMDTIDLGGDDDDDDFLVSNGSAAHTLDDEPLDSPVSSAAIQPMPPSIPVYVTTPFTTAIATTTISLDDDDDDDLDKIVQQASANARKSGSRESSHSSLHIKSQSQSHHADAASRQFDVVGLTSQYNASGVMATPAARLAMWHHALCGTATGPKESISMYAVQTTPLDLPNQSALRKDVEVMSTTIFSSALHAESLRSASSEESTSASGGSRSDSADRDGSRLLFIDNAEILVTYVCKKLRLTEYPPGFALAFGPAIAVGGNDPLRVDLLATIQAACHHVMPHLSKQISPQRVASARRALLKWLLLYHAPTVAFHLDQHFHQWNTDASTVIPDTWLASMFESESYRSGFEFLVKIWDCCVLLNVTSHNAALAATKAFPSTTACFLVVHLIAKAEKKLLRMEGDQLRHCMKQTLLDTLRDEPLLLGVRALIEATPPSFCVALRDAGLVEPAADMAATTTVDLNVAGGKTAKPYSLLSASTNGVMQVGNAVGSGVMQVGNAVGSAMNTVVIDMPTKLLTTIVPIKFTSSSSSISTSAKDPAVNEAFFTQLMREATPSSSVCVTLAARDVIPQVFRSFQAAPSQNEKTIRYFIVDCRARDETAQGQIPTAFHFDPDAVTDPGVLDTVLATLNPLKTTVHMVVMGHGYGHIADDLRQLLAAAQQQSNEPPFFLKDEFLESFARDISRVNAAVLFLAKRGFPHVSVLEGGYAAAHTQLLHSTGEGFSVADLMDHDAPQCSLCHHRRPSTSSAGSFSARTESQSRRSSIPGDTTDGRASPPASRGSSGTTLPQQTGPKLSGSSSGELDAKTLFDGHASPSGGSTYFSSFTGALKTSGKAMGMMNPASSMAGGSKWLMGMKTSGSGSTPSSPVPGGDAVGAGSRSPLGANGMANLSKLKNSLSQIGSESLDMLKKAEQAAAKTSQLKGMFGSMSSSNLKAASSPTGACGSSASTPTGSHTGSGSLPRAASFHRAEEEVFTIDDDDEEEQDDFVGGGGSGRGSTGSRTSSSSSMGHRAESFTGSSADASGMSSTVVLYSVEKGKVKDLTKGMRVSRTQMLPFVESPFFSAYKKKAAPTSPTAAASRASMLPRRLVVAENHVVVLKAERNMDDVYSIKSCHHLSHLGRMTCLKKNALMVTMYYKWKAPHASEVSEKKNAYEVQQRDEFIKVIKNAMEKM